MRYFILILLMVGFVSIVGAGCEDGQIDINSASLEELDEITQIGNETAYKIINARPFKSVEDLVRVSGIKDGKLKKIKDEGLACVGDDDAKKEIGGGDEDVDEDVEEIEEVEKIEKKVDVVVEEIDDEIVLSPRYSFGESEKKVEVISLNSESVEKENELVYVSKSARVVDYLSYVFAGFLIFVVGILIWERF